MGLIAGGIVLYMSCTLAASAGIGGGGLNVPIFYMVFGYSYHTSLKMSLVAVMGNLLSQLFLNYRAHHPEAPSRPLIYWDVVLVLAPALLCGSHAGVVLATILPDTILKALAVVMLTFAAVKVHA
jgi:uncharacterized membrane protein YfcA